MRKYRGKESRVSKVISHLRENGKLDPVEYASKEWPDFTPEVAMRNAQLQVSAARRKLRKEGYVISDPRRTNGIYVLSQDMEEVHKQGVFNGKRAINGLGAAGNSYDMLMADPVSNIKHIRELEENFYQAGTMLRSIRTILDLPYFPEALANARANYIKQLNQPAHADQNAPGQQPEAGQETTKTVS